MAKKMAKKKATKKRVAKRRVMTRGNKNVPEYLEGEGFKDWLKKTKILSSVGQYVLPAAGGALGGLAGTFEAPIFGTVEGGVLGASAGSAANDYLKSLGYGKGTGIPRARVQYATGLKRAGEGLSMAGTVGRGIRQAGYGNRIHKRVEFAT